MKLMQHELKQLDIKPVGKKGAAVQAERKMLDYLKGMGSEEFTAKDASRGSGVTYDTANKILIELNERTPPLVNRFKREQSRTFWWRKI